MKKAFNFRSALVIVLVLVMCLTAFVACDKDKDGQDGNKNNGLSSAREYVKSLYINNSSKTAADYNVVSSVNISGVKYTVKWSVEITTEGVDASAVVVVEGDETTKIDVIDIAEQDINYTLTATIYDANGNTESVSFKRMVPKFRVNTWAEYVAAKDDDLIIADGVVTMYTSKTGGIFTQYGNTTSKAKYNSMYIQNAEGAFYAYSMQKDPATIEGLAVGKTVRISGVKKNYNGTLELTEVAVKEILDDTIKTVEPVDITTLYTNAKDAKDTTITNLQGQLVTLKNVVVLSGDASTKYCYFTLNGVKSYVRPSTSTSAFPSKGIDAFVEAFNTNKGHVATITGQVLVYNSAFYIQPLNAEAVVFGDMANLTPAEEVQFVKDNADALPDVTSNGDTLTLPTQSDLFEGRVKISWTADNTEICKIENGVATFTYDDTKEGGKVKLTATYTHTDASVEAVTDVFEVKLLAPKEITVADFLKKSTGNAVYIITGYIVADGSSSGAGSFVVADATGAVFSYNKFDVTLGEKVKVYGTRTTDSNSNVDQIGTLNVVKVDDGTTYTYPEAKVVDGTTIDLGKLSKNTIGDWTGVYTKVTGLTFYKAGSYNSAGLLKEGKTAGSTSQDDYDQVLSLYSASDAIPEDWAGKPVVVYGYVRGYSTNKYLTIQVAKVEIGYDDATKVAQAKEALTETKIGGTEFDKDFVLPLEGVYGTTISWAVKGESSYVAINGANVTVTKPETERETVTIVATIKSGEVTDTKEFTIAILGATPSYAVNWEGANITAVYGDDNTALAAGGEVKKGTVVKFTVVLPANKLISSVTVNGEALANTAYVTTFSVTVSAVSNVVVNYVEYSASTVANVIASSDTEALYKITGYVVAFGADAGKVGTYAIADESGVAMSFVKAALAVGDYVAVYATKSVDKYNFVSLGVKCVEKLEGGSYVEPTATTIDVNDVDYNTAGGYVGTYYKAVNGTIAVDSNGYVNLVAENGQKLSLYSGDAMKEELKALVGQELEVYCVSRSVNAKVGYWGVQVARYTVVTDAVRVERAAAELDLASKTFGTGEVKLQATGLYDSKITWKSDNAAIAIAADGVTATIVAGTADTPVKLTATIAIGETSTTKEFNVTVTGKTPEYEVTFANVTGATVDVQVDGVAIATGAKVEQGKTLTITVTVDTENYVLVAVKAGATTLKAVEGKYTHQVVADVEITVEVKEALNTPEKIVNAAYALKSGESLDGTYTLTGAVTEINTAFNSKFNNITVTIAVAGLTDKPIQCYRLACTADDVFMINDTITVTGILKNYNGTVQFDAGCTFKDRVVGKGTITVAEDSSANATVNVVNGLTEGDNGSTFSFTVTVASGHELVSVKVNGVAVTVAEGQYTATINGNMIIAVVTKEVGGLAEQVVATATFGSATNSAEIGSYTDTWSATCNGVKFDIVNFNNNKNGWAFIKCGRKEKASVASIATNAVMANVITKVVVTIDKVTVAAVNSIKLVVANNADFATEHIVETVDCTVAKGAITFNVTEANRAANLYYKLVFDCNAKGTSNGTVQVSKVEFYGLA